MLIFLIKELVFLKLRKNIQMNKVMKNIIFFLILNFLSMTKKEYGLVGGKTNYPSPDIAFDYLKKRDNRIARKFLKDNKLKWSRKVIIVNHAPFLERKKDERQALF